MINYFIALAISGFTVLISALILTLISGLTFIILRWHKANKIYKDADLKTLSPIKWALAYALGVRERRLLARLGIRGELRNVAKYFYIPSTAASAYGVSILRKSKSLQTNTNKLKRDPEIFNALLFFEKSFDKEVKRFRINPAIPIKNSQVSSHIDSSIIMALADIFYRKENNKNRVSIFQTPFVQQARKNLRKVNKELATCVEQMRIGMKERVDYLVERLENHHYYDPVHISEISSTTYLVNALELNDLFTEKVIFSIRGYLDECIRPKKMGAKTVGEEINGECMGYTPERTGEWACMCATYLALLSYINMKVLPEKDKDLGKGMDKALRKKMIFIINSLLQARWDSNEKAYKPKKNDPTSIIPSNYSIGLYEWMKSQGKKCKIKGLQIALFESRYQEMLTSYYKSCHVSNNGALVFSFIPGEKANIFATRCALSIDLRISGDHEWPFPKGPKGKKIRKEIDDKVLQYFYADKDFPLIGTQRNLKKVQHTHQAAL